jgi:Tol biopolymer transport system component/predicted Ser/Thr protein kinase
MDPQRWGEIERLYHLAREREAGEREKFLVEACAGDEPLRREVESLLARPPEGQDFLEAPALEVAAMVLAKDKANAPPIDLAGRTIAHYRVLEKIGEGGMGVVYEARDLNLRRFVALKVLPPEHVADPDRKRRFGQEARAASALNHPNIVTIHDITREGGIDFIVMEYVEGKTLDQRIGHRGLRVNDALKYAVQIADALAKAHSAGIVHRDLKPTNIMVNEDGVVKVLDFGLAKLTEQVQGDETASTATVDGEGRPITEEGVIVGTVSYMSPEQAEGKKVDGRSDIFSLGSVLYEMVTGQKAFQGTSKMSTLSAILHQEPKPVSAITQAIPAELERLISRCLRKDPARRLQHMDDVKVALDELKEELDPDRAAAIEGAAKTASPSAGTARVGKRRWILACAAFLAICVLGVGVLWFVKRGVVPPPELKQRRLTLNSIENPVFSGVISPDGKYVAYSDAAGIHLKLIETNDERILAQPSGIAADAVWNLVAWFPDGSRLLANLSEAGGRASIWVISVIAENARRLRDDAISWSVAPDGAHIAYTTGTGQDYYKEIWSMNPQGESAEKILGVDQNSSVYAVQWSPDGRRLAYRRNRVLPTRFDRSLETCTLKGTEPTVAVADPLLSSYCWMPQGYVLYARTEKPAGLGNNGNLWKVPISLGTGKAEGVPKRLTNWVGFLIDGLAASTNGKRLTLKKVTDEIQVYVGELEAGGTTLKSARRLTLDEAWNVFTGWTADSRDVLLYSDRSGSLGLYRQAIDRGAARLVISEPSGMNIGLGVSSPDGSWLLYVVAPQESGTSTPLRVMRMPIHGGPSQLVLEAKNMGLLSLRCTVAPATFCAMGESSPDGKLLTITSFDPLKGRGRILKTVETDPTAAYDWALFPDGSKLAFIRRGEREAHIRLFSLAGGKDQEISVKAWGSLQNLEYTDGKAFYCGSGSPEGATLLRIDMEGHAQVLWRQKGSSFIWGAPSPDRRHLAFSEQFQNSNLWMVEGF